MRKPVRAPAENTLRCIFKKRTQQTSEMAQLVKALTTESDSLSPVPSSHIQEETTSSCKLSSDCHTRGVASSHPPTPPHTHTDRSKHMFKKQNKERNQVPDLVYSMLLSEERFKTMYVFH